MRLSARLGLHTYQLDNAQLVKLFFSIYNPGSPLPEEPGINQTAKIEAVKLKR